MAKIPRKVAKLFGSLAGVTETGIFGSFAAGIPVYSSDPATIQSSEWLSGWFSAILGGDNPCIEDMNSACLVFGYQLAYLMQAGIAEWEVATPYYIGSVVQYSGSYYKSLTNANTGNTPAVGVNWATLFDSVQPGTYVPTGRTTADSGYLLCDGSSLLRASYPALFSAIGTAFGAADGTHFNIPDWRGRFLRGTDGSAGRDPDSASRTAMNTGGNTGNNVGSVQNDQYFSHSHVQNAHLHLVLGNTGSESASHNHSTDDGAHPFFSTGSGGTISVAAGSDAATPTGNTMRGQTGTQSASHIHDMSSGTISSTTATNNNSGGNESRPINGYTNWQIKY